MKRWASPWAMRSPWRLIDALGAALHSDEAEHAPPHLQSVIGCREPRQHLPVPFVSVENNGDACELMASTLRST